MTPWWTGQTANWIGAIAGSTNGLLGALLGTLAGIFVPRGKYKRLILGLAALMLVGGIGSLATGLIALGIGQPYVVWYPMVLVGGMDMVVMLFAWPVINRGYRIADARRLEAEELRRS